MCTAEHPHVIWHAKFACTKQINKSPSADVDENDDRVKLFTAMFCYVDHLLHFHISLH